MTGAVAKRYARALASVAREEGRLEGTAAELLQVAAWIADPEFGAALGSPVLGVESRRALVGQMTASLGLSELTANFLALLAGKSRIGEFGAIVQAYEALVDQAFGRVRATIRTAASLGDAGLAEVVSVLEQICGKKVIARVEVDPSLLAGLTVDLEGRVFDGSARTQLSHLARAMARQGTSG